MTTANLFIIGSAKAGTTSLAEQLSHHPEVFCPTPKEPHYYCKEIKGNWYYYKQKMITNDKEYQKIYKSRNEKYKIDGSVHYIRFPSIAQEIKKNTPNAKIIAIIRNPVDRVFSHYLMDRRTSLTNQSLEEILKTKNSKFFDEYIECSLYFNAISEYSKAFNKNLLIINFESYTKNNNETMKRVLEFLELDHKDLPKEHTNSFRMPRKFIAPIYKIYGIRKIYNKIAPEKIKRLVRKFILKKDKPKISTAARTAIADITMEDYQKTLELLKNAKNINYI